MRDESEQYGHSVRSPPYSAARGYPVRRCGGGIASHSAPFSSEPEPRPRDASDEMRNANASMAVYIDDTLRRSDAIRPTNEELKVDGVQNANEDIADSDEIQKNTA